MLTKGMGDEQKHSLGNSARVCAEGSIVQRRPVACATRRVGAESQSRSGDYLGGKGPLCVMGLVSIGRSEEGGLFCVNGVGRTALL